MHPRKHIAILIAFGPEVRAFIHSGLAQKLARRWNVSIFTVAPESQALQSLEGIRVLAFPDTTERGSLRRIRYWVTLMHQERLRSQGRHRWRHYITDNVPQKRTVLKRLILFLMRQRVPCSMFQKFERAYARMFGTHPEWKKIFQEEKVDCMITSSFASARVLPALQTATNLGILSAVLMNSWKDVYTHPHVAVLPDRIVVWSKQIADDLYSANPRLPRSRLQILPSLHLEKFLAPNSIMPKEQFFRDVELNPDRAYLCYTAASPAAVRNEEAIVEQLLQAIDSGQFPEKPQLLLRLNPMEDGSRFRDLSSRYSDLIIQKPAWEWSKERDWCCALRQDVDYWLATVFYSRLNVSVPSTVSLEFLSMERPVINICFDALEGLPVEESNKRFWEADFYSEIREHPLVQPAFSNDDLITKIQHALLGQTGGQEPGTFRSTTNASPVKSTCQMIEELMLK